MSTTTIPCPHCGRNTRINLRMDFSLQKCTRCGVRLTAVDTGLGGAKEANTPRISSRRKEQVGEWNEERTVQAQELPPLPPTARRLGWAVLGLIVVGVGFGIWWFASGSQPQAGFSSVSADEEADAGVVSESTYEQNKKRFEAATQVAEAYLSAQTVEELLPLILNREALEARVRAFYAGPEGEGLLPLPEFTLARMDEHMWVPSLKSVIIKYNVPHQLPRALSVKQDEEGRWLVDWPSAVALNEVPWADFVAQKDTTPRLFRVLMAYDDYYNHQFSDPKRYICFKLTDPLMKHLLYGYTEVDSPAGKELVKYPLPLRDNGVPMMVRLRFPADAATSDQVEILDPVYTGWIMSKIEDEPGAVVSGRGAGSPPSSEETPPNSAAK